MTQGASPGQGCLLDEEKVFISMELQDWPKCASRCQKIMFGNRTWIISGGI